MTIENTLERIAVALERLAEEFGGPEVPPLTNSPLSAAIDRIKVAAPLAEAASAASTDEIAASMAVAAKAAVATEAKRRGRPAKAPEVVTEAAPPVVTEASPAVEVTKDALRAALVAYQRLCSNDSKPARAIMATHGGADVLAKVPVERYAIVLQAVNDAAAKLQK